MGRPGRTGRAGAAGPAASVAIGSVTTGAAPAVTNSGSATNATLNFTLPVSTAGNVTAYGQVWPGAAGSAGANPVLANSNGNVVSVTGAGAGGYDVTVRGCSAAGLKEPVINVTANADPNDPNRTQAPILAQAESWQAGTGAAAGELSILIYTVNSTTGTVVDADFAFTVVC